MRARTRACAHAHSATAEQRWSGAEPELELEPEPEHGVEQEMEFFRSCLRRALRALFACLRFSASTNFCSSITLLQSYLLFFLFFCKLLASRAESSSLPVEVFLSAPKFFELS